MHRQGLITIPPLIRGAVAQLGERRVRNAKVEGSIPFRSTNFLPFRALTVARRTPSVKSRRRIPRRWLSVSFFGVSTWQHEENREVAYDVALPRVACVGRQNAKSGAQRRKSRAGRYARGAVSAG
jgi:hypothetical protein